MAFSGSMVSSIRSLPTFASHAFSGSTLGEVTDWMIRKIPSIVAAFVRYFFPSLATIEVRVQIVPHLASSSESRERIFLMYCFGSALSVKTAITSVTEKYHSSCSAFQAVRICLSSNIWIELFFSLIILPSRFNVYSISGRVQFVPHLKKLLL